MTEIPSDETREAGAETARYCANCEVDVEPAGKGNCPSCGRFLRDNVVALVHGGRRMKLPPERESRRAELRAQVFSDLGDDPPSIIREVAEDFVSACVLRDQIAGHLEDVGPLTVRGTRRAAMDLYLATSARIERLSSMLADFKPRTDAQPPAELPGLRAMPSSALTHALAMLDRLCAGETLTERELGQFDVLERAMRGQLALPADERPIVNAAGLPVERAPSPEPEVRVAVVAAEPLPPASPESPPPPAALPATIDPDLARVINGNTPEEIAKRQQAATEEMLATIGSAYLLPFKEDR